MPLAPQSRLAMLRRIAQLESELARVRQELKNLRTHDPATAEVVTRGAKLARERSRLEIRLEQHRVGATKTTQHST